MDKHLAILISLICIFISGNASAQGDSLITEDGQVLYKYIERMPEFRGDIGHYLSSNIRYPKTARENNIHGQVIVKFIVTSKGKIDSVVIHQSAHPLLDKEAVRVVKKMPRWRPGRQWTRGVWRKVHVYYTLPISFRLE